jgi:16S rRNA (guanine527-N7)-methyltransferase
MRLPEAAHALGLSLNATQESQLEHYLKLLLKWNKIYNLTAVRDENEARILHLHDCLAIIPHLNPLPHRLLDVGTGAGLPALVVAIMRPDIQVTALDAVAKKISFVRQVIAECGLSNARAVHARIEDHHDVYECVVSRAFASLADFVALCAPRLLLDGHLLAMKALEQEPTPATWATQTIELSVPCLIAKRQIIKLHQAMGQSS